MLHAAAVLTAEAADKCQKLGHDICFQTASTVITLCLGLLAVFVTHGVGLHALPAVKIFIDQALIFIKMYLPFAWKDSEAAKELRKGIKNQIVNALRPRPEGQDISSNERKLLLGYQDMLDVLTCS